jgi:hypothetical protein
VSEPTAPPLETEQLLRLRKQVGKWAACHPEPDRPVLGFADGSSISPRELANLLRGPMEDVRVRQFLRMVQFGLEVASFDEILRRFENN